MSGAALDVTLAMRRCALQALYQMDASAADAAPGDDRSLVGVLGEEVGESARAEDVERVVRLAQAAWEHRHEADREIAGLAREWPPHRQPVVDRNLLRMGWYELRHTSAPAPKVVSDAVELAKEFGAAESGKFVNGVLDRVMHAGAGGAGEG